MSCRRSLFALSGRLEAEKLPESTATGQEKEENYPFPHGKRPLPLDITALLPLV